MADVDVDQWLEGWVENNLNTPGPLGDKTTVRDQAEACASEAASEGIAIAELVTAAGGDLDDYLLGRRKAIADMKLDASHPGDGG